MRLKILKLLISACLAVTIVMIPLGINAEPLDDAAAPVPSEGDGTESYDKREVVYGSLSADGEVRDVYVVNHFEITGASEITDYGDYSQVINLTDTSPLDSIGGSVSFQAEEGNFYYQGNMSKAYLPWDFVISYYLDGARIDPANLAGKSGEVEIHIATSKDKKADPAFYDNYILQVTVTLDAEKCSNIQAPGATIADSGSNKVIVNTVMPGKDGDIEVSAEVYGFTMDEIEISAIPFSMDIETPDTGEMIDEMAELVDAISSINDGVKELNDGVFDLSEGAKELADGSAEFNHGLWLLSDGSGELIKGSKEIDEALEEIADSLSDQSGSINMDDFAQLPAALDQLAQGLSDISAGLTQLKDGLIDSNNNLDDAISTIPDISADDIVSLSAAVASAGLNPDQLNTYDQLLAAYTAAQRVKVTYYGPNGNDGVKAGINSIVDSIDPMVASIDTISQTLSGMSDEIESSLSEMDFVDQMQLLTDGLILLSDNYGAFHSGLVDYTDGVEELSSGYSELHNGIVSLSDGTADLYEGTSELYMGTDELNRAVADLPETIETEIDNFTKEYDKSGFEPVSFISSDNANTSFVQFAIRTDKIELPEETGGLETGTDDSTIWQQLLSLFDF